ncbi:MAG: kinase-like domain-containing protein [Monoraphidium minutum]|nr:MAG: kinase-like domain-containing protein [Monoraphidium minutum]
MQTLRMRASGSRVAARGAAGVRVARAVRFGRVQAAPETGHHTVPDALRDEALAAFFDGPCTCTPTTGGVNNVVNYVQAPDGGRYILRVYNNGGKSDKVAFEHGLLLELGKQELSFKVPQALPALKGGARHVKLSSGDDACVFEIIPGTLAKTTSPREVGRATGELCTAMGRIDMGGREAEAPVPPYYDVFRVHHSMNRELFYQQVAENPGFAGVRSDIDFLAGEIRALEPKLAAYQELGLPMQLIHGDLHYDNVLCLGDSVSGLLDFEFCAYDWRVMEMAVALSKYVGEDDPLPLISEFASGYAVNGELSDVECDIMPDLINLRIFSNVIYFTGRAYAGEDGLESLTSRAGSYAKRVRWVNANRSPMAAALKEFMRAPATAAA